MKCAARYLYTGSSGILRRRIHTIALARELPDSFADALSTYSATTPVNLERARQQHAEYLAKLRSKIPTFCLPPLESNPDSVFVEDTVVAVGNRAVMTRPGHDSRQSEVDSIQEILLQLGMEVFDMRLKEFALCDGGDVLSTGRHLFVGLSHRTNQDGARFLQQHFDDVVVVPPVVQGNEILHLKSAVTHLNEHTLLAPIGPMGDAILQAMQATERGYETIRLPNVLACNVVSVNDCILAQDCCSESRRLLQEATVARNLDLEFVDTSELAKKDGALTCCSVLLSL